MRQTQLPLLGLLLALVVGARVGSPGGASESSPAASSARKSDSSSAAPAKTKPAPATGHSPKHLVQVNAGAGTEVIQTGCEESTTTSNAGGSHTFKSVRNSADCLPALPPLYSILCELNPQYNSDERFRHEFEQEELQLKTPDLPDCLKKFPVGGQPRVLSVIASVPDPVHTHLGLLTDRAIEVIQVAASKHNYNPYSHFLPWPSSDGQKTDDASPGEGEADSHTPGILIFRRQDSSRPQPSPPIPPQYLVVFLIPELPTTGLDQESFFRAKRTMEKMSEELEQPETDTLKKMPDELNQPEANSIPFAGPNFSGSLASLGDIDRQVGGSRCIHAFSGQVTAAKYSNHKKNSDGNETCQSKLVLTQTPDCASVPLLVKGLTAYGYDADKIALLSEGGTAYGNQIEQIGESKKDSGSETPNPAGLANVDPVCLDTTNDYKTEISKILNLRFPREISKVRNAYGATTSQTPPAGSANQQPQDTDLQLSWRDSQATRGDDLPTYGGDQTPFSQDAVLSNIAIALKTHQIKVLGILATDPMDVAFLIRSFRKSSPNVRLLLFDPDLLFLRTPDAGSLNGSLLVSNHPMILRNQLWSAGVTETDPKQSQPEGKNNNEKGKDDKHLDGLVTFSSSGQEAQYDALLLLLREFDKQPQEPEPGLLEWNWPAGEKPSATTIVQSTEMSPLWLTTIGTTGQFPLAILQDKAVNDSDFDLHTLAVGDPRYAGMLLWLFFVMLGLLHVGALSFPNFLPRLISDDFDLADATDTINASKALCHTAILLIVALIQFVMGSSYVFFLRLNTYYAVLGWGVIAVAGILVATACVVFFIRAAWPLWHWRVEKAGFRNMDISGLLRPFIGSIFCFLIFGSIGVLWAIGVFYDGFSAVFLHFRDLILASGVAPFVPIIFLLLVVYLGAWVYLRRLTYWGFRRPQMPSQPLDDVFPSDFTRKFNGIDQCILVFLENRGWTLALLSFTVIGILAFRPWTNMDIIEAPQVRWTARILFGLAFFTLALNWFRFLNIWSLLRSILQGLERLPIRHAFERMPTEKSMPIWGWGISDTSFLPTTQAVETLRALERADGRVVSIDTANDLKKKIKSVWSRDSKRKGIWGLLLLLIRKQKAVDVESKPVEPGPTKTGQADPSKVESRPIESSEFKPEQVETVHVEPFPTALPEAVGQSRTEVVQETRTSSIALVQSPSPVEPPKDGEQSQADAPEAKSNRLGSKSVPNRLAMSLVEARNAMVGLVNELIGVLSADYWQRGSGGSDNKKEGPEPVDRASVLAEDLVAVRYYTYIRYVVTELRNLLFFIAMGFSLLFLAFHTYAFRADQSIDWSFLVLFLVLAVGIIWVGYQMELDLILGHFGGRDAEDVGKVGLNFYLNLLKYGAVPVLTVIGSQVPAVSNLLLRWVQPTLQSLR